MAVHQFSSAKADGTDATLVRPSDWNAVHIEPRTVTASYTIPAGASAIVAGPYELAAAAAVEIAAGAILEIT